MVALQVFWIYYAHFSPFFRVFSYKKCLFKNHSGTKLIWLSYQSIAKLPFFYYIIFLLPYFPTLSLIPWFLSGTHSLFNEKSFDRYMCTFKKYTVLLYRWGLHGLTLYNEFHIVYYFLKSTLSYWELLMLLCAPPGSHQRNPHAAIFKCN